MKNCLLILFLLLCAVGSLATNSHFFVDSEQFCNAHVFGSPLLPFGIDREVGRETDGG